MLNVLLITYDTSPVRGSEAAVSWNFITQMSQQVRLTIIFGHGKEEVESYLQNNKPIPNTQWINIPVKSTEGFNKLKEFIYFQKYYRQWQLNVYRKVRSLTTESHYDIVHFLNPIGFKEPGYCWRLNDTPYVWGPIQGVENRPLGLTFDLSKKYFIKSLIRRLVHNGWFRYSPRVRKAIKSSDAILSATPNTVKLLNEIYNVDAPYLPENGIVSPESTTPINYDGNGSLNLIWVGAVIERKALKLLLLSLEKIRHLNWHLDVVGDGPLLQSLKEEFAEMNDKISYHGKVIRTDVCKLFSRAHLHIITSLGEATTTVLFEAMAKGVPTLTLDHCGMAGVISSDNGIKIPLGRLSQTTDLIASSIANIMQAPPTIRNLSKGTISTGMQLNWDYRCKMFLDTYELAIRSNRDSHNKLSN